MKTATAKYSALIWKAAKAGDLDEKVLPELERLASELGVDVEVIAADVETAKQILAADATAATKPEIAESLKQCRDDQAEYSTRRVATITALDKEMTDLSSRLSSLQAKNSVAGQAETTAAQLRASNSRLA